MFSALTGDEAPDRGARDLHVRYTKQWRTVAREPEEPLERKREVEVAARVEPALGEGVESGEPALAEGDPRRRVGSDDYVWLTG